MNLASPCRSVARQKNHGVVLLPPVATGMTKNRERFLTPTAPETGAGLSARQKPPAAAKNRRPRLASRRGAQRPAADIAEQPDRRGGRKGSFTVRDLFPHPRRTVRRTGRRSAAILPPEGELFSLWEQSRGERLAGSRSYGERSPQVRAARKESARGRRRTRPMFATLPL